MKHVVASVSQGERQKQRRDLEEAQQKQPPATRTAATVIKKVTDFNSLDTANSEVVLHVGQVCAEQLGGAGQIEGAAAIQPAQPRPRAGSGADRDLVYMLYALELPAFDNTKRAAF